MEDFVANARFCLMCNHPNQLIEAIRSRCTQIRFPPLNAQLVKSRLSRIAQLEKQGEVCTQRKGSVFQCRYGRDCIGCVDQSLRRRFTPNDEYASGHLSFQ